MKLPRTLIDVELAFSRETDIGKCYVQDKMRERASDLAELLTDPATHIYICGHKRMEAGVMDALTDICETNDLFWPSLMEDMRQEGRFHVETYF